MLFDTADSKLFRFINWCLECLDTFIEWSNIRNVDDTKLKRREYGTSIF